MPSCDRATLATLPRLQDKCGGWDSRATGLDSWVYLLRRGRTLPHAIG